MVVVVEIVVVVIVDVVMIVIMIITIRMLIMAKKTLQPDLTHVKEFIYLGIFTVLVAYKVIRLTRKDHLKYI